MSLGPNVPGQDYPARCTTIELKDLADTDQFDLEAEIGAIYGFEFTDEGFYKRREIDDKKVPRLEQLRNVEAEYLFNAEYKIGRQGGKWIFQPEVKWDIKYEFISPYTLFDKQNKFRKALNAAPVHCSIVPNAESRGKIEVNNYSLHSTSESGLSFVPQMPFSDNFTLIFDVFIKDGSLDNSVNNRSIEAIEGVSMNWLKLTKDKQRVTVVLRKEGEGLNGMKFATSVDDVDITIIPNRMNGLNSFNLTHFDLIRLYYRKIDLPDRLIQMLTKLQFD